MTSEPRPPAPPIASSGTPDLRVNVAVARVTTAIATRSQARRATYLEKLASQRQHRAERLARQRLSAANLAHGYAALPSGDKLRVVSEPVPMIGIVSAYNDVLSAHQPMAEYPAVIKGELRRHAAVAQFAGGVPAMCDGVTQGQPGMELSLFSRDVIAMSTAVALSHDLYDGAMLLGVCDKIVPGLLLGALSFGHLPAIFVPAGPMPSGLSNKEKASVRKQHAQGKVPARALLEAEMAAYHSEGTCTFYGTANSNQLLLEAMGLMLPGAAFVQPNDSRRAQLTRAAATRMAALAKQAQAGREKAGLGEWIDERVLVNAIVALLATGGSTNHTMHWVAIARAAGFELTWQDIDALSQVTPLLTRLYPNGDANVNDFDRAGGTAFLFRELLAAGLMHDDVETVMGRGMALYTQALAAKADAAGALAYQPAPTQSGDASLLRPASAPFSAEGGLRVLAGNLGEAVIKVSAVAPEHRVITAPAHVFDSQADVIAAFKANRFERDAVVIVRFQGPRACGMPELHQLTPALSVLLDRGIKVALVTDGRMSGASGRVPAAIHVTPEAAAGGGLARVQDGDVVTLDCDRGTLRLHVDADVLAGRNPAATPAAESGWGRELFTVFRDNVADANVGASVFFR
ncbi:MAG: phosphogluconate dehydratase [Burkholderiales bacterium]|nr:phosphogluconate dehydratase [Burkholderiales bacterium]